MNTTTLLSVSFALFLAALPLISFGATGDNDVLWWAGLVLLAVAGVIPPVTRFVGDDDGDAEEGEREGGDAGDGPEGDGTAGAGEDEPAGSAVPGDHPRAAEPPKDRERSSRPRAVEQRERAQDQRQASKGTDTDEGGGGRR